MTDGNGGGEIARGGKNAVANPIDQMREVLSVLAVAEESKARYQAEVDKVSIEADRDVRLKSLDVAEVHVRNLDEQQKRRVITGRLGMAAAVLAFISSLVYSGLTGDSEPVKLIFVGVASFFGGQGYAARQAREQEKNAPPGPDTKG